MKKRFLIVLFITMILLVIPLIANAATVDSGSCGTNVTWTLDDTGILTISGTGAMNNYSYSDNVTTAPWGNTAEIVIIVDGVTSVGSRAFYGCTNLTNITIPGSVTSIDSSAFYGCSSLTSITIPDSVTSIGMLAFYDCKNITDIHIDSIESWMTINYSDAFSHPNTANNSCHLYINDTELTSITIPDSVTSISKYAFYHCSNLKSISISDGVTSIGNWAFSYCSSLTSITIPDSVISIGEWTFYGCSSLTSSTLGDNVTSIGDYAFSHCSSLESITIPDSVTSIGSYAFDNCNNINEIHIDSIESWLSIECNGNYCRPNHCPSDCHLFIGEAELTSIIIPAGVINIGDRAFSNCSSLTSITIPDGVTSIGNWAFSYCSSLTSITIPDSVISIGRDAFNGCRNITDIHIDSIESWLTINYSNDYSHPNTLFHSCHLYINDTELTSITIPESITSSP